MLTNTLRIKRRGSGSAAPPESLAHAELAYNEVNDVLYYGKGAGGLAGTALSVQSIAGAGAYVTLGSTQNITGDKTFNGDVYAPTVALSSNTTAVATTAFVKGQAYLVGNQTITVSGDAEGTGTTEITLTLANVGTPGTYTKVTTDAKGRVTVGESLDAADIPTLTAAKISDFNDAVRTNSLDLLASPTASVSFNSQQLTNLGEPTVGSDAATKKYVDAARTGLDAKASVKTATTENITLSGLNQVIDGIDTFADGDRILVKNQNVTAENGIYTARAAAWERAADANQDNEVSAGMFTFVEIGLLYANTGWVLQADASGDIILGVSPLVFVQFSGAGALTAGDGLTQSGTTFNVGAGTGIAVSADAVSLTGQALALHNLAVDGLIVRTSAGSIAARTITSTTDSLIIANGNGIAANPSLSLSSALAAVGSLTPANDRLAYYTSANAAALTAITAHARNVLAAVDAPAGRAVLGLGTISTQNSDSVDITGGNVSGITIDGGTF
jgi:hypothetical protein